MRGAASWRPVRNGLVVLAVLVAAQPQTLPRPAAAGPIGEAASALPAGARQFIAGVQILRAHQFRNRTYRQARSMQADVRARHDALIETARRQLLERKQIGLRASQVVAYERAATTLAAERDLALALTEDEKRAAKVTFEGRVRRELVGALVRTARGQKAIRGVRDLFGELRDGFRKARAALEGGNPIAAFTQELQREVDRLRTAGEVLSIVSGKTGAALRRKADRVQGLIDDVTSATRQATAAADAAIESLESSIAGLDALAAQPRTPRAERDRLLAGALEDLSDRLFAPGGEAPVEDVVADAIARGFDKDLVHYVGIAVGEVDPARLRTLRERVRGRLLAEKLAGIAGRCGRFNGALHNQAVDALTDGAPAPPPAPCSLFRNPAALRALIEKLTPAAGAAAASRAPPGAGHDGTYVADRIEDDRTGAIIEVLSTSVKVRVSGGAATGTVARTSHVRYKDGGRTLTQKAAEAISFEGTVDAVGKLEAKGLAKAAYSLISCTPEEHCRGVTATQTGRPGGVPVTIAGAIAGDTLDVEIVNSVSRSKKTFHARRERLNVRRRDR